MGRTLRRSKRIGRKPLSTKSMKPLKRQPRVVLQRLDEVEIRAFTTEGNKCTSTKKGINRPSTKKGNKHPVSHQNPTSSSWLEPGRVYLSDLQALSTANDRMYGPITQLHEAVKHLEELNESGTNSTAKNKQIKDSITQFHETVKHLEELYKSAGNTMFDFFGKLCNDHRKKKLRLKPLA
uniref:Uncharacterized protein n=1 Tax=Microplitis mediator bracovirus TaxID=1836595 RepID=A0A1D5APG5_9VIRU|nr:hypothetical protein A6F54_34 [Microplitis mediator bracovirus]